jgi:hypothetical protein
MDRTIGIFGVIAVILVLFTAGMVGLAARSTPGTTGTDNVLTIAKNFITDEPTYMFDGMKGTLTLNVTDTDTETGISHVAANFTSAHSGYGDRTNMMVLQVLTPHTCVLTISGGKVTSAVMDGKYDMIAQKMIQ